MRERFVSGELDSLYSLTGLCRVMLSPDRQRDICAGEVHGEHPGLVLTMWCFMTGSLFLNA